MCPSEGRSLARLKLDNVCMCTKILVITKDIFKLWAVKNEVRKGEVLNEIVGGRGLKIGL